MTSSSSTDLPGARAGLLRDRNFRWMMSGALISALGDQFTLIALPWLVLKMTGDPLALGLVIALMSIPRAIFILFGGALVDRISPKKVLILSKYANALLLGTLSALVLSDHASLPAVCILALGLGLASAFSLPAATSLLPHVVEPARLPMANGVLMGMYQITMLAGPLLAALLFALASDGSGATLADARALAYAFGVDCLSFIVSAWTLSKVVARLATPPSAPAPILREVGAGLAMVWNDRALRMCLLYWSLCAFVVGGPMQVALPLLASSRLQGASALGLIMSAHSAGTLCGMALTALRGGLRVGSLGTTLLLIDLLVGLLVLPFGAITRTWQAFALMLAIGLLSGYMQVAVFTWIQQRVPQHMLGRAMSIVMFSFMGLAPLAAALAGALLKVISLDQLFAGCGVFLVLAALAAFALTPIREIADPAPAAAPAGAELG